MGLCAAQPSVPQLPYPQDTISELRKHFKDSIREICEHAAQRGITILLEPLNGYEGHLFFYMPQTTQQIFRSTPGITFYGKSDPAALSGNQEKKDLAEYLAQPIRLLKEIERTVDLEREQYELDSTRY